MTGVRWYFWRPLRVRQRGGEGGKSFFLFVIRTRFFLVSPSHRRCWTFAPSEFPREAGRWRKGVDGETGREEGREEGRKRGRG